MKVGIVGTGGRSLAYLPLLRQQENTEITALCDIDAARLEAYCAAHFQNGAAPHRYTGHAALAADPAVDTVLILTPDTAHRAVLESAVRAGKHILLEKPIATTIEDAAAMFRLARAYPRTLEMGFVLRHTAFYQTAHRLVTEGTLGDIISISAKEMLDTRHAGSFYRRWNRFVKNTGGLMNAKCSHDLDILNWLAGSVPKRVAAFGGRRLFVPRDDAPERCADCPRYQSCLYAYPYGYYRENYGDFHSTNDLCVYNSDKDIVDHEVMALQYQNGVVATFELCMAGYEENRFLTVHGTAATLRGDFNSGILRVLPLKGPEATLQANTPGQGGHGGGDGNIIRALYQSVTAGPPVNNIAAGFYSTATALAGEQSMLSGETVDLEAFAGAKP